MNPYLDMDREQLLEALQIFAKHWLAHDGCWFLAVEDQLGLEDAIELDRRAWERFAAAEARRIMTGFDLPENGGLEILKQALALRMYAVINRQHSEWLDGKKRLRFVMDVCRVQETRRRKGLDDFPCKPVGIAEFTTFARTIDPRIQTTCLHCPPDADEGQYCGWEFTLAEDATG